MEAFELHPGSWRNLTLTTGWYSGWSGGQLLADVLKIDCKINNAKTPTIVKYETK